MFELIIFEIVGFMDSGCVCVCVYVCMGEWVGVVGWVYVCRVIEEVIQRMAYNDHFCLLSTIIYYGCVYYSSQFTVLPLAAEPICHVNHPHLYNTLLRLL